MNESTPESAPVVPLNPAENRFAQGGQLWQHWQAVIPDGTPPEHHTDPAFWARIDRWAKVGDIIEVTNDMRSMYAILQVRSVDANGVRVAPIGGREFKDAVNSHGVLPANPSGARVYDRGPARRWCVEQADGSELHGGFKTQAEAFSWLSQWLKTTQAPR